MCRCSGAVSPINSATATQSHRGRTRLWYRRLFYGVSYRHHLSGDNSRDRHIKGYYFIRCTVGAGPAAPHGYTEQLAVGSTASTATHRSVAADCTIASITRRSSWASWAPAAGAVPVRTAMAKSANSPAYLAPRSNNKSLKKGPHVHSMACPFNHPLARLIRICREPI